MLFMKMCCLALCCCYWIIDANWFWVPLFISLDLQRFAVRSNHLLRSGCETNRQTLSILLEGVAGVGLAWDWARWILSCDKRPSKLVMWPKKYILITYRVWWMDNILFQLWNSENSHERDTNKMRLKNIYIYNNKQKSLVTRSQEKQKALAKAR